MPSSLPQGSQWHLATTTGLSAVWLTRSGSEQINDGFRLSFCSSMEISSKISLSDA